MVIVLRFMGIFLPKRMRNFAIKGNSTEQFAYPIVRIMPNFD